METVVDFIFLGSKTTAYGVYSHEIKRQFLLGRKAMTNLDSMRPQKCCDIPVSLEGTTEVPGTTSSDPFSSPDCDRRVDSPSLSARGSRPSGRTSG